MSKIMKENIPNKKLSKYQLRTIEVFSCKVYMDFFKRKVKWQNSTVNHWSNKSKTQVTNPFEKKFPKVHYKIRKKKTTKIFISFINKRSTVSSAAKYRLKEKSCRLNLLYEA